MTNDMPLPADVPPTRVILGQRIRLCERRPFHTGRDPDYGESSAGRRRLDRHPGAVFLLGRGAGVVGPFSAASIQARLVAMRSRRVQHRPCDHARHRLAFRGASARGADRRRASIEYRGNAALRTGYVARSASRGIVAPSGWSARIGRTSGVFKNSGRD